MNKVRNLMHQLVDKAFSYNLRMSSMKRGMRGPTPGTPGEAILKLSKEQRELLQTLKAEDIDKIRPDAVPPIL
jgi:hypothetical protein